MPLQQGANFPEFVEYVLRVHAASGEGCSIGRTPTPLRRRAQSDRTLQSDTFGNKCSLYGWALQNYQSRAAEIGCPAAALDVDITMKGVCTGNALSDLMLTSVHRSYFETLFGPTTPPVWNAEPGREYTVYGIRIIRGYPFYWVERCEKGVIEWSYVPSVCFSILDNRPSSLWRIDTRIIEYQDSQIFRTLFAIREFLEEPTFHSNLVESQPREVAIMRTAAAQMDAEFS